MDKSLTFPVTILKANDSSIYIFSQKTLGLISIGGESFYNSGTLYDSKGNKFRIDGVKKTVSAPFWDSLRFVQRMKKVELNLEFIDQTSLKEFRAVINRACEKQCSILGEKRFDRRYNFLN